MLKRILLAVALVAVSAIGARAADDILSGGKIDLNSIKEVNNSIVTAGASVE